jgi:hypothetical protein
MEPHTPTKPSKISTVTTPQRLIDATREQDLKSTPSNRGSASVAEHIGSYRCVTNPHRLDIQVQSHLLICSVDDVSPAIFADIENHATCSVVPMLNYFLRRCSPGDPPPDLLDQCLKAVLPICNEQQDPAALKQKQTINKKKQKQKPKKQNKQEAAAPPTADGSKLRQYLKQ